MGVVTDPTWTFILADGITDTELVDITHEVTATIQPRISRPLTLTLKASQADSASFWSNYADGHRYDSPGDRIVKAYRNGVLRANTELVRMDWTGTENGQSLQMTCYDPMWRLPMRMVRDADGRIDGWKFVDPKTYSTKLPKMPAGSAVQQLFQNSATYDDQDWIIDPKFGDPPSWFTGARTFPFDYTSGDFSATGDIFDLFTNGPLDLGTFIYSTVTDTGVCDVVLTPTETALGAAPGIYGVVNCVNQWGSDKSATVHFDYNLGDNSIKQVTRSLDMATVVNRLKYLLGPKSNRPDHWAGSIDQPINASQTTVIEPEWDNMWLSRERYGTLFAMRPYDSDAANTVRWLFHALFNTEMALRLGPRELVAVIPSADCPFKPWDHYDIGDIVEVNLAKTVGPPTDGDPAAKMRIYGFDVDVDVNGVESVTTIYNSADAVQSGQVTPA